MTKKYLFAGILAVLVLGAAYFYNDFEASAPLIQNTFHEPATPVRSHPPGPTPEPAESRPNIPYPVPPGPDGTVAGYRGDLPEPAQRQLESVSQNTIPTTAPAASGRIISTEPAVAPGPAAAETAGDFSCTLLVSCETLLNNLSGLDPEKIELVPEDGILFPETQLIFYEGESVFNLLQRTMKQHHIHFEFTTTPLYGSAYIEGIGNLYEFDCGDLSGWNYRVNGAFPAFGCSFYTLSDGDRVELLYTCDLGADIGGTNGAGGLSPQ